MMIFAVGMHIAGVWGHDLDAFRATGDGNRLISGVQQFYLENQAYPVPRDRYGTFWGDHQRYDLQLARACGWSGAYWRNLPWLLGLYTCIILIMYWCWARLKARLDVQIIQSESDDDLSLFDDPTALWWGCAGFGLPLFTRNAGPMDDAFWIFLFSIVPITGNNANYMLMVYAGVAVVVIWVALWRYHAPGTITKASVLSIVFMCSIPLLCYQSTLLSNNLAYRYLNRVAQGMPVVLHISDGSSYYAIIAAGSDGVFELPYVDTVEVGETHFRPLPEPIRGVVQGTDAPDIGDDIIWFAEPNKQWQRF